MSENGLPVCIERRWRVAEKVSRSTRQRITRRMRAEVGLELCEELLKCENGANVRIIERREMLADISRMELIENCAIFVEFSEVRR